MTETSELWNWVFIQQHYIIETIKRLRTKLEMSEPVFEELISLEEHITALEAVAKEQLLTSLSQP